MTDVPYHALAKWHKKLMKSIGWKFLQAHKQGTGLACLLRKMLKLKANLYHAVQHYTNPDVKCDIDILGRQVHQGIAYLKGFADALPELQEAERPEVAACQLAPMTLCEITCWFKHAFETFGPVVIYGIVRNRHEKIADYMIMLHRLCASLNSSKDLYVDPDRHYEIAVMLQDVHFLKCLTHTLTNMPPKSCGNRPTSPTRLAMLVKSPEAKAFVEKLLTPRASPIRSVSFE